MKKRKILMPVVMASLVTVLGVGTLGYASRVSANTDSAKKIAPYNTVGNAHGFGTGRGQGASGTITAINGTSITINTKNNKNYVVDLSEAKLLKAPTFVKDQRPSSPTSINLVDIKVGDTVMVRGTISDTTIKATVLTDGVPMINKDNAKAMKKPARINSQNIIKPKS